MAEELYRNDYMTVTEDAGWLILAWTKEEPNDEHSVGTARAVAAALDKQVERAAGQKFLVLVDLMCVKKTFPRATAAYTQWLLGHRAHVKAGAFATGAFLLRTAVSASMIIPGVTMKGFANLEDAKAYLRAKA